MRICNCNSIPSTINSVSSFNRYSIKGAQTCPDPSTSTVLPVCSTFEVFKEMNLLVNRKSLMYSNRSVSDPLLAIIA